MLDRKEQSIVAISVFTAIGDLPGLSRSLHAGLDAGLSINEIKEVLVHLYAYCGFPRSIRGLQTFMDVLEVRSTKGILDSVGKFPSPAITAGSKYDRGRKILGELTRTPQNPSTAGYGSFAPVIDTFLKEHLFADIFERDVLSFSQRELVTISVLSAIGGVEPMLRSHMSICLNVGISPQELTHFVTVIDTTLGQEKASAAAVVLKEVLKNHSRN